MIRAAAVLALLAGCSSTTATPPPGSTGGSGGGPAATETCDNGVDDDGDGKVDCADSDCAYSPHCPFCGDGLRQDPEACEGEDLGGSSCLLQHFEGGRLRCKDDCTFDTSGCVPPEDCSTPGDEDKNGLADCADPVCASLDACLKLRVVDPPMDTVVTTARTIVVKVIDGTGAPAAGKQVRLTAPPGAVAPDQLSSSDPDGLARFEIRAGRKTGPQTFVATLDPGPASVDITLQVTDVAAGNVHTVVNLDRQSGTDSAGPALAAHLASLLDLAVASDDTLYLAEPCRILRISPEGVLSVVAGNGSCGSAGDGGSALESPLSLSALALDEAGNRLLFVDLSAATVRSVDLASGILETVAGGGTGKDGGPAWGAALAPGGLAAMPDGGFYVTDTDANAIRRVTSGGTISTVLNADSACAGEVSLQDCHTSPCRPLADAAGALFVSGGLCGNVGKLRFFQTPGLVRLNPGGGAPLTRIAGMPSGPAPSGTGATLTGFPALMRAAFDPAGNFFAFSGSMLLRIDDRSWVATAVVSWATPVSGGENVPVQMASFASPAALAFSRNGDLYVADARDATVRRIVALGQATLPPSTLVAIADSGDGESADLCQKPSEPVTVRVFDAGQPLPGLPIAFSTDDPGIALYPGQQTDSAGRLSREVRLGMVAGPHQIVASINDIHGAALPDPVTFHVTATEPAPGTIFSVTGEDGIDQPLLGLLDGPPVPAAPIPLTPTNMTVAPDGAIFSQVSSSSQQIVMLWGGTLQLFGGVIHDTVLSNGDGGPAKEAMLSPGPMAAGEDTLYFFDNNGTIRTIDRATGIVNKLVAVHNAQSLVLDKDGTLLAGVNEGIVRIDPATGTSTVLVPATWPCEPTGYRLSMGPYGLTRWGQGFAFSGGLCRDGVEGNVVGTIDSDGTIHVLYDYFTSWSMIGTADGRVLIEDYDGQIDSLDPLSLDQIALAGGGPQFREHVPALQTYLNYLGQMGLDPHGHLFLEANQRIRVVW